MLAAPQLSWRGLSSNDGILVLVDYDKGRPSGRLSFLLERKSRTRDLSNRTSNGRLSCEYRAREDAGVPLCATTILSYFVRMNVETHLFLVRHGETDFNRQGIVQGRGVNAPLNETGLSQASALAQRFQLDPVDVVYSSPLQRALQTAACVAEAMGIATIPTDPDLEEMSWGIFEGQSQSELLHAAFEEMKQRWQAGEHDYRVQDGESLRQVQSRGVNAIDRILATNAGKKVLVIAHGRFLRILLATLLQDYGIPRMEEVHHTNTGVNHLVHDGTRFAAITLNCTRHLSD